MIEEVFGEKKRLTIADYLNIIENKSSEMFLSLMVLIQSCLPCSENFYRYKHNYEKIKSTQEGEDEEQIKPIEQKKSIASPRYMNVPFDFSQQSHQFPEGEEFQASEPNSDFISKMNSKNQDHKDKEVNQKELQEIKKKEQEGLPPGSPGQFQVVRQTNTITKTTGGPGGGSISETISSPTHFLSGARGQSADFFTQTSQQKEQLEGEMVRMASENKFKIYWYCLLGKELYVYKNKNEEKHKGMHNLVGVFIEEAETIQDDQGRQLYAFQLIFPLNKSRIYYCLSQADKDKWMKAIKKVVGYSSLFDFYEIKDAIGKGKFGLVKSATHKKTQKNVAVKIMSKAEMTTSDIELQMREIEILKMC